jgi:hypothetical protein
MLTYANPFFYLYLMVILIPTKISSILLMGLHKSNSSIKVRSENYSNLKSWSLQKLSGFDVSLGFNKN